MSELQHGFRYSSREAEPPEITSLRGALQALLNGFGLQLIELAVSKHRGSVQIRLVIYAGAASLGVEDCSKVHRAVMPRLELAFPSQDIYLEVSSPGIERLIKDGMEAAHYLGRGVRCYCTDINEWTAGILEAADEKGIMLKNKDGVIRLEFDIIAKARLDSAQEV